MRMLSNWIASYAEYTDISEAPLTFDFWTGLATISGALRRQVYIDEVKFKLYPNMYIIFVAPPGVATKSTTMGVGMKILREVDGVTMGPSTMTWQGLTKGLKDAEQSYPISSPDIIDPLAIEYNTQSAITCEVSELGTFLNMQDDGLIAMLIDLWDGRDVPWERWLSTKENVKIINPLIGIVGATTPSWLERHFDEIAIGNGLTSRIVFVYGEAKRRYIPYVSDLVEAEGQKQLSEALVHDLREIAKLKGKFTITREARNLVGDWYEQHWTEPEEHLQDPRFAGYRARKFAHLHKVAMCLSASEGDSLVIDVPHIALAFHVLGGIEGDMLKVLNTIGKVQSSRQMDAILATLRVRGRMLRSDLWKGVMSTIPPREFSDAIDGLAQAGVIKLTTVAGEGTYIRLMGGDENGNNEE
jgi:hypothetical protein